jgi:dihydroorotate dehydrogenase electron transfer subunit
MVGPLGVGFSIDPAWKHVVVLGRGVGLATLAPISQLAAENGIGVTAILRRAQPGIRDGGRPVRQGRRGHRRARLRTAPARSSNVELMLQQADRRAAAPTQFYTCGSKPPVQADEAASARSTAFPARSRWSR